MAQKTPGSIVYAAVYFQGMNKEFECQVDAKNLKDFEISHSHMLQEVVSELRVDIRKIPEDPLKYEVVGYPRYWVFICAKSMRKKRYLYGCVANRTYRMRICRNFLEEIQDTHLKEMRNNRFPMKLRKRLKLNIRAIVKDLMKKHNNPLNDQIIRGFHLMDSNQDSVRDNIELAVQRSEGMDVLIKNIETIAENAVDLKSKAEDVLFNTGYAKCMIILIMIFCVVFMVGVCVGILGIKYGLVPYLQGQKNEKTQNTVDEGEKEYDKEEPPPAD